MFLLGLLYVVGLKWKLVPIAGMTTRTTGESVAGREGAGFGVGTDVVTGPAFRLRPLRKALQHCFASRFMDRVWKCKPADIADYCYAMKPGIIPGSALPDVGQLTATAGRIAGDVATDAADRGPSGRRARDRVRTMSYGRLTN